MSLFNYTFSGLQIQSFDPVAIQYSTSNAGQLRSRGGDLELRWKAPTDGLTLSAAVAYTDAEFTETFISNAGIDLKGRAAPRAPSGQAICLSTGRSRSLIASTSVCSV